MSEATDLETILNGQPKPDCAALTPFPVEDADFDAGRVVLQLAVHATATAAVPPA